MNVRTQLLTAGVAIAVILGVAYVASAQQMDGKNCEWAYKKHQQHRVYGVCNEKAGAEVGGSVAVHEVERVAKQEPAKQDEPARDGDQPK